MDRDAPKPDPEEPDTPTERTITGWAAEQSLAGMRPPAGLRLFAAP